MAGEIFRQREAIEAYFRTRLKHEERRERNILDYLEVGFSENRLRQYYALYLWGRSWKADYGKCPEEYQARAENAPYEEVILSLVKDWVAFKKAPAESEL